MTVRPQAIIGYQPDLAPDTPGVLVQTTQALPTDRGIRSGLSVTSQSSAFSGRSFGGFESVNIVGTNRPFIGTATKLWELTAGVATDVSGSVYNASVDHQWTFAQYGNTCLAINKGDRLQASAAGVFADAFADAPKASVVIVAGPATRPFAILFDYNDGTDVPHGIYWNPDPSLTWATSIATQVGNLPVIDINGKFTAAVAYKDGAIAFKNRAMYEGRYVGGNDMWVWDRISSDVGCLGPNAVCLVNDVVYFADSNGIWQFDGSYPKPVPGGIHQWFANNNGAASVPAGVRLTWDKRKHIVWVRYNDDGFGDGMHLAFNPRSQLWTHYQFIGDAAGLYLVDHLIGSTYAASFAGGTTRFLQLVDASPCASTLRLWVIGSEYGRSRIGSLRPHWIAGPSDAHAVWCSATLYYGPTQRNVTNNSIAMDFAVPGRFDKVLDGRFIQPELSVIAGQPWEMDRISTDGTVSGQE